MSMGSELYSEMLIENVLKEHAYNHLAEKGVWLKRNGEYIKIPEMDTSHIKNTIAYIKKNGFYAEGAFIAAFTKELSKRK